MRDGINRREFMKVVGVGAAGLGGIGQSADAGNRSVPTRGGKRVRVIGRPLRLKPALVYQLHHRRQAWSWRPWGGLHSEQDVQQELKRIESELRRLKEKADFPMEVQPVALVRNQQQAAAVRDSDCDAVVIYAAGGGRGELDTIASSKKPTVMFLRHKSGPVYLWYEIAHPHFLRRATDEYKQPDMDVWDIVVDDYEQVLWRLRALYGLTNAVGAKIVAIGNAGGWGEGRTLGPEIAKKIWKLDIRPVSYKELEPMIKKALNDKATLEQAKRQTKEYLGQKGVTLRTELKFVVHAFVLTKVFKQLMERADAPAITVNQCMGTIIPMAQTTACMPLSLLNDEGLMAFCESDFVVIPAGILLRYISGKPVFLNDPTHPHDGVTTCAHCTAPRRMNGRDREPVEIHTHFESDYGAAPKVLMRKGQVITNIVPDFHSQKWLGCRGKIIGHPFYDICRSQIDLTIEGDWRALLEDMRGFHWMSCYGDYLREVGYACKKLGIGWRNISDASAV